jgi:hypothetical protein
MKHGNGTLIDTDGSTFSGEFFNDSLHGYGIVQFPNGSTYEGTFEQGLFHGNITLTSPDQPEYTFTYFHGILNDPTYFRIVSQERRTFFEGFLQLNLNKGSGRFVSESLVYDGGFLVSVTDPGDSCPDYYLYYNNLTETLSNGSVIWQGLFLFVFHGQGILQISNQKYIGSFNCGFIEGYGTWTTLKQTSGLGGAPQVLKIKGTFWKGYPHGQVVQVFNNGIAYKGQMLLGRRQGIGTEIDITLGLIFTGNWVNDRKDGNGTLMYINGTKYEGEFIEDQLTGKAKISYPDGSWYQGNVTNGVPEFYGALKDPEKLYLGQFKNGKFHGYGQMLKTNGDFFDGQFSDGLFEGFGEYYWKGGLKFLGLWKNGTKDKFGYYIY